MEHTKQGRRVSREELNEWLRLVGQPSGADSSPAVRSAPAAEQKAVRRICGNELRDWEFWNDTGELPPEDDRDGAASRDARKRAQRPDIRKPAKPAPQAAVQPPDQKLLRRLSSGRMRPDRRTDLHGMTVAEAHEELGHFITVSHRAGSRLLLVITGKGARSRSEFGAEGGILNRTLPDWLSSGPCAKWVWHYCHAHPRHGGTGAYYVLLRRPGRSAGQREG